MSVDAPSVAATGQERLLPEIYPIILSFLPRSDLPSVMTVSSAFYTSACHYLYASMDIWPAKSVARPYPSNPDVLAAFPSPYSYITHLTIEAHSHHQCGGKTPLVMPNLVSLRMRPSGPMYWQAACHCTTDMTARCERNENCACPLIGQLRPSQVILETVHDGRKSVIFPWLSMVASLPACVEHLIIMVFDREQTLGSEALFTTIPGTVKRLTLVIRADVDEDEWSTDSEDEDGDGDGDWDGDGDIESKVAGFHLLLLGLMDQAGLRRVDVVGFSALDEEELLRGFRESVEVMRMIMAALAVGQGWTEREAEEKAGAVGVMSAEDFIQEASGPKMRAVREVVREARMGGKYDSREGGLREDYVLPIYR